MSDGVGRWPAGVRVLLLLPGFHHTLLILSTVTVIVVMVIIGIIVLSIAFFESLCFL